MIERKYGNHPLMSGHRIFWLIILCLFGLCLAEMTAAPKKKKKTQEDRIHLLHADELYYDMYGKNPEAQIVKGNVSFSHDGATLKCDSAYFFQGSNSFKAFSHVKLRQGDTLSLDCEYAEYDGGSLMMRARRNVVLRHHRQTLYTDSLDYDRLYEKANFFEGGTLIDGKDKLVADWGEYSTATRDAVFYYNVKMRNGGRVIEGDTLYYSTKSSTAHLVGPSTITSENGSIIKTEDGYFDTKSDKATLYGRSTLTDKQKFITGDSLYHDNKTGENKGFGNVVYVDKENKNELHCDELTYNDQTGYGYATKNTLVKDYSQKDTLFVHADTFKIYTYHINTDSVYRLVHGYNKVRAYRTDIQAVCDSIVFSSLDSCMTMYKDPIVWNDTRQLFGEQIKVFMNDSTIRMAQVIDQASSIELMSDSVHYNQVAAKRMNAYFVEGAVRETESIGNVQSVYYPVDDKDSTLIGLNYMETDTMRMFLDKERKLEKIWVSKPVGVLYPITQIPSDKMKLKNFAWFEQIRPKDKNDIFVWRGKSEENRLKKVERHAAPLQTLTKNIAEEK